MAKAKVLLVYPNLMFVSQLPNNIALLSAVLKESGHDVKLFDSTFYQTAIKTNDQMRVERMQVRKFNIKDAGLQVNQSDIFMDFARCVKGYKPDLIGITVVDDTVKMAFDLLEKADCVDIPVLVGGVHAMFNPEQVLSNKYVDMVCVGEGEKVISELVERIVNKKDYRDIGNLWIKDKNGIIKNKLLTPVDINSVPMEDFSIFEKNRIYRPMQGKMVAAIPVNFDRGCPYRCSFCAAPYISDLYKENGYRYYRRKSLERIYQEMKYFIKNYKVSFFYFNSETFLSMSTEQLGEFAEMYKEFYLPFWCQTRIETVTDERMAILKKMKCARLSIGLEHGNEDFRRRILSKNFTNDQVREAFKVIKKNNIPTSVNNMIGFPDETRELAFDTIRLNREIEADAVNGFVFQPYLGTYLHKYSIEKGYLQEADNRFMDLEQGTPIGHSFLNMPQFPKEEIEGILRTFSLYVRMPESYFPRIREAEKATPEGDKELDILRELFFEKYFNANSNK